MKRKAIEELIKWKELKNKTPIILTGAKGVGKTYLAYDFAKAFFKNIYYLNFEREPLWKKLFLPEDPIKTNELLEEHFHFQQEEQEASRILILDEISCCREALQLLDTIHFDYIIAISSNPIPKEYKWNKLILPVYPLEFDEFLRAIGSDWYIELIQTHFNNNNKIPDIVHEELLELFRLYLQIGGMPGILNEYLNLDSVMNIAEQHNILIGSYHDYIKLQNEDSEALKMNQVFDSIMLQLLKENKKFQYKLIRKGTTYAMYKDAISRLKELNYVISCSRISNAQLQACHDKLKAEAAERKPVIPDFPEEEADTAFKLYLHDTGMLYTRISETFGNSLQKCQKIALYENYVAQALQAKNYLFGFWESDSMAKIDFIICRAENILPIEIFENSSTRSKSISVLKQKYDFDYAVKISTRNFEMSNGIKYVPYYAVFCI